MKKSLLFLSLLLCISCDPIQNAWYWSIKNCTEQVLQLRYFSIYASNPSDYLTVVINPGDSVKLISSGFDLKNKKSFEYCFEQTASMYGEDVYWQILSESGDVLKTWIYSERHLPGERFFKESSWHHYQQPGTGTFLDTEFIWVFDILPEDIIP